jgi:DNA-binding NarL/FixJ family response regulator
MNRMSARVIRVLCADDHPLVRTGIRTMLRSTDEMDVVGEAENGHQVAELVETLQPDVLLLDLNMPALSPYEMVIKLKTTYPALKVIALTAFTTSNYVQQMVSAGVDGYVIKDEALETIVRAIKAVMFGAKWFDHDVLKHAMAGREDEPVQRMRIPLTEHEVTLLKLLATGQSDLEIAASVHIAERTLRHQLRAIYDKIGANSRIEAAVRAVHLGLVPAQPEP